MPKVSLLLSCPYAKIFRNDEAVAVRNIPATGSTLQSPVDRDSWFNETGKAGLAISRYALYGCPFVLLLAMALFFGGCTNVKRAEERAAKMTEQNQILRSEIDNLQAGLALQNAMTARLQMELVQKKEEIVRLRAAGQGLAKEIASNTIRTPAANTRVETVAYLAEVATEIETAREKIKPEEQELFAEAEQLMVKSNLELENDRYEQATNLAAQALDLISLQQFNDEGKARIVPKTYADFITPLDLRVARTSNIRKAPGIRGKVVTTIESETGVTAIGHKGYWIKVSLQDGRDGWIYYSLLSIPKKLQ